MNDLDDVAMRPHGPRDTSGEEAYRTRVKNLLQRRKDTFLDQLNDLTLTPSQRAQAQQSLDAVKHDIAESRYEPAASSIWRDLNRKWQ